MSGQKNDVTYAATVAFAVATMRELGLMPTSNTSTDPPQDDLIEMLRSEAEISDRPDAPQAESPVTVPADPRAAAEQAIAEELRRERMALDDYKPMPDAPVPLEKQE